MPVQRITCFKITDENDIQSMIDQYDVIRETNQKDGKPYILSLSSHKPVPDPRTSGFNLISTTKFASMDDVKYYDESCEAHQKLKDFAKGKVGGPPMVLHLEE
ncbi:hypothetical protein LTR86_009830 [Recurvomyces mirabilis]|nr:hypothetical protein LTR86_009830 [Recurvomyces mirabilis]